MRSLKIRELINDQKRKAVITAASGMSLFTASLLFSNYFKGLFSVAAVGFVIAAAGFCSFNSASAAPGAVGGSATSSTIPWGPLRCRRKSATAPFAASPSIPTSNAGKDGDFPSGPGGIIDPARLSTYGVHL